MDADRSAALGCAYLAMDFITQAETWPAFRSWLKAKFGYAAPPVDIEGYKEMTRLVGDILHDFPSAQA